MFLELQIYTHLSYVFMETSILDFVYSSLKIGVLAKMNPSNAKFTMGMASFASFVATLGWPAGGKRHLRAANAEDISDLETKGKYCFSKGVIHSFSRELQLADQEFREALSLLLNAGSHWQAVMCAHIHRHLKQIIGSSRAEVEIAETELSLAQDVGDIRGQCWGNYDLASGLARAGNSKSAKAHMEKARSLLAPTGMDLTTSILLCTDGYVRLLASDYANARTSLEQSWHICKSKLLLMEYNVRSLPLLIESITGPNWLTAKSSEGKVLRRLAREAQFMYWLQPNLQSAIQRARGRAFWLLGKKKKAIRCFERAIATAESLGTDYDRARHARPRSRAGIQTR